jgi:hypothetical protein
MPIVKSMFVSDEQIEAKAFQEYPKHINFADKTYEVVNNKEEEDAALKNAKDRGGLRLTTDDKVELKVKQTLLEMAELFGISVDANLSLEELKIAIKQAKEDKVDKKSEKIVKG